MTVFGARDINIKSSYVYDIYVKGIWVKNIYIRKAYIRGAYIENTYFIKNTSIWDIYYTKNSLNNMIVDIFDISLLGYIF